MKAAPQKEPLLTWPKMAGLLNVVDCTAAATQPGDGGSGRPWLTWPEMVGLVNDPVVHLQVSQGSRTYLPGDGGSTIAR